MTYPQGPTPPPWPAGHRQQAAPYPAPQPPYGAPAAYGRPPVPAGYTPYPPYGAPGLPPQTAATVADRARRGLVWGTAGIAGMLIAQFIGDVVYGVGLTTGFLRGGWVQPVGQVFALIAVVCVAVAAVKASEPARRSAVAGLGVAGVVVYGIWAAARILMTAASVSFIFEHYLLIAETTCTLSFGLLLSAWIVGRRRSLVPLILVIPAMASFWLLFHFDDLSFGEKPNIVVYILKVFLLIDVPYAVVGVAWAWLAVALDRMVGPKQGTPPAGAVPAAPGFPRAPMSPTVPMGPRP
ncbi:MAG: hypothetical protein QM774_13670 [Gordonia sp. (in: high G+C Gram-positive bacteria)]|uniref:hypothetical protein n=1 Tax=Gordonia sp. (in: high G+C Gram-positive bacteria) TaxID=84139 RepID=UPI0039E414E6